MSNGTQTTTDNFPQDINPDKKERIFGALGSILGGGTDKSGLEKALDQHHQRRLNEAKMYYQNASLYYAALTQIKNGVNPTTGKKFSDPDYDGEPPEELRQQYQAWHDASMDAYEKVAGVNKEIKAHIKKSRSFLDMLLRRQGPQQQPQQGSQGPSTGAGPAPSGGEQATLTEGEHPPQGASPRLAPPPKYDEEAQMAAPLLRGQMASNAEFADWRRKQEYLKQAKIEEEQAKEQAKAKYEGDSKTPPRPVPAGQAISVRDARSLLSMGKVFEDENGDPIDVENLQDEMSLKPFILRIRETDDQGNSRQVWRVRYIPISPNQKVFTVGNETYAVNPADVSKTAGGAGVDLGEHNVPRTHTSPGVTLEGNIGPVTTTTTPITSGITGRKGGAEPPPKMKSQQYGGGPNQAIPFGAANQLRQVIIPLREAAAQIFGDPSQPSLQSMRDFADLAEDPEAKERLGKALKLTFDGIGQKERAAGGIWSLIGAYGGLPQALASMQAEIMRNAEADLKKPMERNYYRAVMSAYGAMVGIRSLTKASAAQASVETIERELPLIGINTADREDYLVGLSRLAEIIYNGTKVLPLSKEDKEFYKKQVGMLTGSAPAALARKGGAGKPPRLYSPSPVDKEIMKAVRP